MIPMCDETTGAHLGWAIGSVDCDGTKELEYFDVDGVSEGATLPAGWKPCIQGETGPAWTPTHADVAYSATVDIDFLDDEYITIDDVSGNLTFTGSNYTAARTIKVRLVESGAVARTVTLPTNWKTPGTADPYTLGASKTAILVLDSFTNADTGVVARWEVQS
jgi:hypothetical protein